MKNAIDIALKYLKFRPRTVFEIREKLRSKKFEDKEINKVIAVLKRNKLLDDENFAKMWISDRNLFKPSGAYLIKMKLRNLGISDSIIEKNLAKQNEEELAKQALESKSRYRNADFEKKASFLQRRGFGTDVIYKVLKK